MKLKLKKNFGKITCVALAFILAVSVPGTVLASAASTEKDETVYVNMDTEGNVVETIVSDWLHSDTPVPQIPDKTDLKNVENVKSNDKPAKNGDNLTWMLSSNGSSGSNIYYKGTTDKKPPLDVSIQYFLNDKPISAKDLAGKSGKVRIKIKIQNNDKHTVNINGKNVEMYTPMSAFLIAALPSKTFKNVELSEGKVFSDGNNQIATFLAMPGMNESLNIKGYDIDSLKDFDFPDELEIKADAEDFKLSSIAIAATPELVGIDKLKDSDDIDEMRTNLNKLKDMQDDIEKADPNNDIRALFTNPDKTAAARILVDDVFDFYDMDKALADILPDYVTDENIALYDKVTSDLDKADIKYVLDNKVFRDLNDRLTDENIDKGRLLIKDYDEIQTFRMDKLDDLIEIMDDYDKNYDDIDDLLHDAKKAVNRISYDKDAIDTMDKLASNKDIKNGLEGLISNVESLTKMAKSYGVDLTKIQKTQVESIVNTIVVDAIKGSLFDEVVDGKGYISVDFLSKKMESLLGYKFISENDEVKNQIPKIKTQLKYLQENHIDKIPYSKLEGKIDGIANVIAKGITSHITDVLGNVCRVQKGMDKEDISYGDISDISNALRRAVPKIKEVKEDIDDLDKKDIEDTLDKTEDFVLDEDNMHYMRDWAHKIRDMKKDLDSNRDNVDIMRVLLHEYDDPKVKNFKNMIPTLKTDLDETRPIAESLKDKLDLPVYNASLHKSPDTVRRLLKIKDDVIAKRNIIETLRLATQPNTTTLFKNTFDTFDELKADNCVDDYIKQINDADELLARKDAYVDLSENYDIFTKAADGASTKLKFVMKTQEIEKPKVEVKTVEKQETKQDFFSWFKTAFQKAANSIGQLFNF